MCDKCGNPLTSKVGRYGKFYACTGYPKCRFTKPIATDIACPRNGCDGKLVRRRGRKGFFFGCSNYPECDFTARSLDSLDERAEAPEAASDTKPTRARSAKRTGTATKTPAGKPSPKKTAARKATANKTTTRKKAKTGKTVAAAAGRPAGDDESAAR